MAQVAVALGAGGARGYAHLGAVEELRARGHEIVALSGTSMGALVGGAVVAGKESEFADWVQSLTQTRVVRMLDPSRAGGGAVALNRLIGTVKDLIGDLAIEDLPIPYTAVATDLAARREVWFQRGPLIPAIRASIAIPGLFTPAVVGGRVLVDGGLLNPLPLDPTAAAVADFTFAVSLQGPREPHAPKSPDRGFARRELDWVRDLGRQRGWAHPPDMLVGDLPAAGSDADTEGGGGGGQPDLRTTEVLAQSFDAMQSLIARYRLAAVPPDVLVTIPVDAAATLDFHRAAELIALGRKAAATALDEAGR